jgi:hypothetical protein
MPLTAGETTSRPLRCSPAGAGNIGPPVPPVAEVDGSLSLLKDERTGNEEFRRCAWTHGGIPRPLGHRDVACLLYEARKLLVGHFEGIHPESAHRDVMNGRFLSVEIVAAHQKGPAGNPLHAKMTDGICSRQCKQDSSL